VDCTKALELLSASLDNELDRASEALVQNHIRICTRCRTEYELEKLTRDAVRRTFKRVRVPADLSAVIAARLESELEPAESPSFFRAFISKPLAKTALSMSVAVAVFLLFVVTIPSTNARHTHAVPNDGNIIHETYSSFDGMMNGTAPQFTSSDPNAVKEFLASNANFPANVPPLKRCRLMGASYSKDHNEPVAHIVYKFGNDVVYVYETRFSSIMNGGGLNLPPEVQREMARNGWYVENHVPNCTLIVWKGDTATVCCALAEMNKQRLVSALAP